MNITKLSKLCSYYQLIATAGMMRHSENVAKNIIEVYLKNINEFINNKTAKSKKFKDNVLVDLSDLPKNYDPERLQFIFEEVTGSSTLPVIFTFKNSKETEISAEFFSDDVRVEVSISVNKKNPNINTERVYSAVIHELVHLTQMLNGYKINLIKSLKNPDFDEEVEYVGTPSTYTSAQEAIIKNNITDPNEIQYIEYILDPVEFYPLLSGAESRMMRKFNNNITKNNFDLFVGIQGDGQDKLFQYLKKYSPPSWKKAVAELWKKIQEKL